MKSLLKGSILPYLRDFGPLFASIPCMYNRALIEEYYNQFIRNLPSYLPDGVIEINLQLLKEFDLLHFQSHKENLEDTLNRSFYVIESPQKITLISEAFVVWIIPDPDAPKPFTQVLIALQHHDTPHLETAFKATGVYNDSSLILRLLEKFLSDIQENEDLLKKLG